MSEFKLKTYSGKIIVLNDKNEIYRGGEGRILLIDNQNSKLAKIYHSGIKPIDKKHFDELQKLDKNIFITPDELLYQDNAVVGFTMKFAGKDFFALASCFNKSFCKKNNCNQKLKFKIAQNLINAVKSAHKNNIVIGDLNQYNVLLDLDGNIKLIDTDSYKIPGYTHSGLLLDEIRDYLYNGIVNINSDYFALSVLLFYLFTYTHPFKGVHQKYKKISERMIHKIPVFADDPLLKKPKCYSALQDDKLQNHFKHLYIDGERFLLNISGHRITTANPLKIGIKPLQEKELLISIVAGNTNILNVSFDSTGGYIETNDRYIIFSSVHKGLVNRRFDVLKAEFEQIFVSGTTVLAIKDNALFNLNKAGEAEKLKNIRFEKNMHTHQFGSILLMIGQHQMYKLYLDEILNNSIKNHRIEIFGEGFSHHAGLVQNSGGVQRIFYNTGKEIATVKSGKNIKAIYQKNNVGIVQYIENKQLINRYFKIKGLKQEFAAQTTESFSHFAYMPSEKDEGFIFEPSDTGISVIRTHDFKEISKMKVSFMSSQTALFYTQSGIVAWEDEHVYLINRKE
jgi:serine/threonine protein kinase